MSEINVKVRSRAQTLYNTKVLVNLEEPVSVLKKKICEKYETLQESLLEAIYCGCVLEDSHPIYSYNVFQGATVHVYKKTQTEKPSIAKPLDEDDLVTLELAVCSLSLSPVYRKSIMKHTCPEEIVNVILNVPGLSEDPVAISLLPRFTLLVQLGNFDVKCLAQNHPALASAILYLGSVAYEEIADKVMRTVMSSGSDETMEDIDDSSTASETSSSSESRNFGTISAAQLASEITNVTNQQPQPSTGDARTSTTITGNPLNHLMDHGELSTYIEFIREIGLTDEAQHLSILLQISNMLDAVFV